MNVLYTPARYGEMSIRIFYSPVPDLIDTLLAENNNDKLSSDTNIKYVLHSPVTLSRRLFWLRMNLGRIHCQKLTFQRIKQN
jgi:hypothetical protein